MELLTVQRLAIEQSYLLFLQLFAIGLVCTFFLLILTKGKKILLRLNNRKTHFLLVLFSVIPILNYLILIFTYLTLIDYADPAEANVASVSWLLQTNHVLYPALDAAERYINNYGPFLYIIQGFFLRILHPSFFASKVAGCLSGLLSLILIFLTLQHRLKGSIAVFGCAIVSLSLLSMTSASGLVASAFWVRPDSLLLFCTAIALFAVVRGRAVIAAGVSAIALGISVNLKITAFLHFLPIYVLLFQRFGLSYTVGSVVGAGVVAIAPFALSPQISLANYLTWLRQVGQKGLNSGQIIKNLLWTSYVLLPCAIAALHLGLTNASSFRRWLRQDWFYVALVIICVILNAIAGATRGALENNMLPFVPLFVYPLNQLLQRVTLLPLDATATRKQFAAVLVSMSAVLAFVVSVSWTVYSTESLLLNRLFNAPGYAAVQDVDRLMASYPKQTIGMGYGGAEYRLPDYRPALVFAGNPYLLDSASLMEMQASGLNNTPKATLKTLSTCQTQVWLIPKHNKPFDIYSYYPPLQKLFSSEFRKTFLQYYDRVGQTQYYDVWACSQQK